MTITSFTMDFQQENKKNRRMVFHKMEQLVKQMSESHNGIQVRTQKLFLSTIPKAFTGSDLIDWLMKKLYITEVNEAYHLASLLCHYGYIFPITDKSLIVKEDGSLYRFQCPYYWPQSDMSADNEAYAIHLTKRSMRNKQKHGLEDYEQAALNRLKTMYSDKWNMIHTQAANQVRIAKSKKKIDKTICDSQERAFWRVHKPAPGQIKSFEEHTKRNFSVSQITAKKESKEYLRNKVNNLSASLEKPRMRMSKVIESYQNRVEQYHDFDPFFCPPHPSNPWITDDITAWTFGSNCDQLTEKRVKMWSFGLHEVLSDPAGLVCFESFLRKEFSHENIHFWLACKDLKSCAQSQVASKVDKIYEDFLARGARCEINIDCKTMEEVQANLKKKQSRYTFEPAESHIYTLMKKDSYARFLRSEEYKTLLANAVQPTCKKKFFSFTSTKKRTPTPSPLMKRRGSTSSDHSELGLGAPGAPCHSYSTGNLKDLGNNSATYNCAAGATGAARMSLPPVLTQGCSQRKCLEVPSPSFGHVPSNSSTDTEAEDSTTCLVLSVPSKLNIVAPWEQSD